MDPLINPLWFKGLARLARTVSMIDWFEVEAMNEVSCQFPCPQECENSKYLVVCAFPGKLNERAIIKINPLFFMCPFIQC